MSEKEIDKIEPVDFDVSASPLFSPEAATGRSSKPSPWAWIGLGALVIVALAVVFVLPAIVSEYELPLERRADLQPVAPGARSQQSAVNAISPFEEAQRMRQRKEAQDVLAELLSVQEELDRMGVESWAGADYANAVELARLGDDAYLGQAFTDARDRYQEGLQAMHTIRQRVEPVLNRTLIDGENALLNNDSALALDRFTVALEMEPGNARAQVGLDRARSLDEVNSILADAVELKEQGQLEAARDQYRAALNLDSRSDAASEGLNEIRRLIAEREFSGAMSQGYAMLQEDRPEEAILAFQRAESMGVNAAQAQAAIQQTRDEVARVEIERLVQQAEQAQAEERWQDSMAAYDQILAIDSNLIVAQQGRDYTGKRQNLDRLLEDAINDPLRLSDDQVYEQTLDVYYTGRNLENAGPRLVSQLDRLETLMRNSQQQETVSFVSDNSTQVTLLRIGEMGVFQSHSLTLKPGRYVAIGVREGYRDVREEFVVGYGQTPEAVVIQCDERIIASGGR